MNLYKIRKIKSSGIFNSIEKLDNSFKPNEGTLKIFGYSAVNINIDGIVYVDYIVNYNSYSKNHTLNNLKNLIFSAIRDEKIKEVIL